MKNQIKLLLSAMMLIVSANATVITIGKDDLGGKSWVIIGKSSEGRWSYTKDGVKPYQVVAKISFNKPIKYEGLGVVHGKKLLVQYNCNDKTYELLTDSPLDKNGDKIKTFTMSEKPKPLSDKRSSYTIIFKDVCNVKTSSKKKPEKYQDWIEMGLGHDKTAIKFSISKSNKDIWYYNENFLYKHKAVLRDKYTNPSTIKGRLATDYIFLQQFSCEEGTTKVLAGAVIDENNNVMKFGTIPNRKFRKAEKFSQEYHLLKKICK